MDGLFGRVLTNQTPAEFMTVSPIKGLLHGIAYSELIKIAGSQGRAGSREFTLSPFGLLGAVYKSEKHGPLDGGGLNTLRYMSVLSHAATGYGGGKQPKEVMWFS